MDKKERTTYKFPSFTFNKEKNIGRFIFETTKYLFLTWVVIIGFIWFITGNSRLKLNNIGLRLGALLIITEIAILVIYYISNLSYEGSYTVIVDDKPAEQPEGSTILLDDGEDRGLEDDEIL